MGQTSTKWFFPNAGATEDDYIKGIGLSMQEHLSNVDIMNQLIAQVGPDPAKWVPLFREAISKGGSSGAPLESVTK